MLGITNHIDTLFSENASASELMSALAALPGKPDAGHLELLLSRFDAELESLYGASFLQGLRAFGAEVLDTSGTGGSGIPHFNTSTSVAFIVASAGIKVCKFGNRAVSGKSGSVDFLDRLGILTLPNLFGVEECLEKIGLTFLSARNIYPTVTRMVPVRQRFARRSMFNFIGPLLNPIKPGRRVMGCSDLQAAREIAFNLRQERSAKRALIVNSGKLDEYSIEQPSHVFDVSGEKLVEYICDPKNHIAGVRVAFGEEHSPEVNAKIFLDIIARRDKRSACYYSVVLNAAAALVAAERVSDLTTAVAMVENIIASGEPAAVYEKCRRFYARLS